jgi:hypothetical protein
MIVSGAPGLRAGDRALDSVNTTTGLSIPVLNLIVIVPPPQPPRAATSTALKTRLTSTGYADVLFTASASRFVES